MQMNQPLLEDAPERATVWCALSSVGIFSPVFIDNKVSFDV
jgi:hypothetical protein